jgi:CO dehydrogenase maturation factor
MTYTIAVAGKGGVGKTSFCALLMRWLIEHRQTPVLAVDADPNSNLAEALGLGVVEGTVSDIISKTKDFDAIPPNMSQDEYISYRMHESLTEGDAFDLIAMGGPEGPGCYCFPNNVLKKHLQKLSKNYRAIVMDNEAGLEHISRGTTTEDVDELFILSDTSARSVRSAARIHNLTKELKVPIKNMHLILTRGKEGDIEALEGEISQVGLPVAGMIPEDRQLVAYEIAGKALYELPADSPSVAATNEVLDRILGGM